MWELREGLGAGEEEGEAGADVWGVQVTRNRLSRALMIGAIVSATYTVHELGWVMWVPVVCWAIVLLID